MEKSILKSIGFELQFPTPISIFKLMVEILLKDVDEVTKNAILMTGQYLCYLVLLDISL